MKDRLYQRSQVTNLTKEQALAFASEPEPEQAEVEVVEAIEALEYDENIAAWAAIVREWMVAVGVDSVSISELVDSTELSSVKAWLAGLLGDFELEQTKIL
ncbi:MAG: hypothetical protein HC936_14170 [Leptolyngbyaceae cyanobacterium SU_3_3]|nr:hypothetical protein [Leptolyngbyaceae cyanobacterium SU_3_3]